MENPIRYGEVVRGVHFAGRVRERAELAANMRSGQNAVVISPRRYGKSSLVLAVLDELGDSVPHAYRVVDTFLPAWLRRLRSA